jgi:leader peptidase (prepilin peptidase)/N-methyltransferase
MGPQVIGGLLAGLVVGWFAHRWLERRAYRYDDEADFPARATTWVPPVLAVALALVAMAQGDQPWPRLVFLLGLVAALVVLSAIDIDVLRLPDRWTGPLAAVSIVGLGGEAALRGEWGSAQRILVAAIGLGLAYLVLSLISRGDFGLGDVKLAPTIGAMLGTLGWPQVFLGTFLAFLIAAVWGLARKLARKDRHFPFGPHMVLGAVIVLVLPLLGRW